MEFYLVIQKVVPYSITSVGHGADPGFLAVSPPVTLAIVTYSDSNRALAHAKSHEGVQYNQSLIENFK